MLRAEQAALQRSLEKERARASETRQELLALKEEAATHEGRASQLEDEMKELRAKHRKESQEAARKRESVKQVGMNPRHLCRSDSFGAERRTFGCVGRKRNV
jgi:predicted nuclease with TOPRIM domain